MKFVLLVACALSAFAQTPARAVVYASSGPDLTQYQVDPAGPALIKGRTIRLPANVQYAWPHPSRKYFYIVWSDGGASAAAPGATAVPAGNVHGLGAFRIDPRSGALEAIGQPARLPSRPIHVSVDSDGTHVLAAYNDPSGLTVHSINTDGTIGAMVNQSSGLDTGIYAHQIRVGPSGRTAFLVTRGNAATSIKAEDRGAVRVFSYANGVLKNLGSIAPNGGMDFQPRHLDFHPTKPWVYVSLEHQSKLQLYQLRNDGSLDALPLFTKDSLADSSHKAQRQNAGTLHVHPNGKFVYQANRAAIPGATGRNVDGGGENSIAVYSINQQSGEPTRIQNVKTRGGEPRTFALDTSGRILVAANQTAIYDGPALIPASLALFRVREDGLLDFVRTYDVDTKGGSLFWMGIISLP